MAVVFLQNFLTAGQDGLRLLATAVLPVLFPFFVLTTLLLAIIPSKKPWLVASLAYFSGYPNGARLTKNLYEQGYLTATQAQHLALLTATPSPIFVIATVGIVFLHDLKMGLMIFSCAVLAALINGYLWRPPQTTTCQVVKRPTPPREPLMTSLSTALSSATNAIVNVCGVVLFFYILARLLHLPPILSGMLEMTTGTASTTNPLLLQFFVSFGGLSVAMQQQIFTTTYQLKLRKYFLAKLTHALLACGLLSVYLLFFE